MTAVVKTTTKTVATAVTPHTSTDNNDGAVAYVVTTPAAKQPAGVASNLLIEAATPANEARKAALVAAGKQAESV